MELFIKNTNKKLESINVYVAKNAFGFWIVGPTGNGKVFKTEKQRIDQIAIFLYVLGL